MPYLNQFNEKYSLQATLLVDHNVGFDLEGCSEYSFYKIHEDQNGTTFGQLIFQKLGSYCSGEYFEEKGVAGFHLCKEPLELKTFYPIAKNKVTERLTIEYKKQRVSGRTFTVLEPLSKWWVESVDEIKADYPDEGKKVEDLLIHEISTLANIARNKNFKSGWVYNKFMDKHKFLQDRINFDFLKNTTFFFSPVLFYNQVSRQFITYTRAETQEAIQRHEQMDNQQFW